MKKELCGYGCGRIWDEQGDFDCVSAYHNPANPAPELTRVEIIDHTKDVMNGGGRVFVYRDDTGKSKIELSYQDDGRTLKVFIKPK